MIVPSCLVVTCVTDAIGVTIVLDSLKTRPIKVLKRLGMTEYI